MTVSFAKYQGTGNDFILIDNRERNIKLTTEQIANICDRRFGIGGDGLIYILPSEHYDFEMKYFNADGKEGSMCGNGGRCITAFAYQLGMITKNAHFNAIDGEHKGVVILSSDQELYIELSLNDVELHSQHESYYFLDTGSPHYVEFVDKLENINVKEKGKAIRWDRRFKPDGTNVNFVELGDDVLNVVTFERGVEDITLSCGTGVTAAAIAADVKLNNNNHKYNISTPGGELKINFERDNFIFSNIKLSGPVVKVFEGTIKV